MTDTSKVNTAFCSDEATNNNNNKKQENIAMQSSTVRIEDTSSSKKYHKEGNCSMCLKVLLLALAVCFAVAFAVFLIMYIEEKDKSTPEQDPMTYNEDSITAAAEILGHMNQSVDPCQDFYAFSCGGWQQKTLIPSTKKEIHILSTLSESNKNVLRNLLGHTDTKKKYSTNQAVLKTIDYYQLCLRKDIINKQGASYLESVLQQLGGSNLTTRGWNATEYKVMDAMLVAFRELGVHPFFTLAVFGDFTNSTIRRLTITEGGVVLARTFYLKKNASEVYYATRRTAYQELMAEMMTLLGADPEEAKRQTMDVFQLEEKIAELTSIGRPPHTMSIERLTNFTEYDWLSFFTGITANQSYTITKDERILLQNDNAMKAIIKLINSTDKAILSNYIAWTVVNAIMKHLPSKYGDLLLAYNKKINEATYGEEERWDTCLQSTKKSFPMPIGLIFVDKKLKPAAKERASEIFEEIRREFLNELDSQTWMDEKTRAKAREKAEAMTSITGYPQYIMNEDKLNMEYEPVHINASNFLSTVFNLRKFLLLKEVANLRLPVDRHTFHNSPADVNAYHYHQQNKNVFLAGILLPPFYDPRSLRASNYGGIGMIAGHELSHGFDITGRVFDKNGNNVNWWSLNSSRQFLAKSQCLRNQYSEYEMYGKKLKGQLTLGENIADNGGLKFAYEAYQRWTKQNGEEDQLPGLDYTPNQLFFISYAQIWCSKYTRQAAIDQIDNLPWPPMNLRVLGNIHNSKPFSEAFNCKVGSPMNPVKKCALW